MFNDIPLYPLIRHSSSPAIPHLITFQIQQNQPYSLLFPVSTTTAIYIEYVTVIRTLNKNYKLYT